MDDNSYVSGVVEPTTREESGEGTHITANLNSTSKLERNQPSLHDGSPTFDLVVIGSGGAAFAAAIEAKEAGARVAMIERGTLGGTCVNIGCVPSKTLLRAGEVYHQAKHHAFAGLQTAALGADMSAVIGQKDKLIRTMRQEKYADLINDYGWTLLRGEASFLDDHTLQVGPERVTANHFLIATGARPKIPDIPGLKETPYLTSTTALNLKKVPSSLVVIGSGYIALELGQFFRNLGARVTLTQRSPRPFKVYDREISDAVTEVFSDQGIEFVTGARFDQVESTGGMQRLYLTVNGEPHVVEGEELLVAAGRWPNTEALDLEKAGVAIGERGEVLVDEYLRTNIPHIYAAGDVTLGPQFVYIAAHGGRTVAANVLGTSAKPVDLSAVPAVTFTTPSIASVGLTETDANDQGFHVMTSVLPLSSVPRAIVNYQTDGLVKLVADGENGRILGAQIVSENAGEMIYAATLAVRAGLTVQDLQDTLAPYLTFSEGIRLAAQTFNKDVSKLSCCAG